VRLELVSYMVIKWKPLERRWCGSTNGVSLGISDKEAAPSWKLYSPAGCKLVISVVNGNFELLAKDHLLVDHLLPPPRGVHSGTRV
jgi:hypothetical protein